MTDLAEVARSILMAPLEHEPYRAMQDADKPGVWWLERRGIGIGKLFSDGSYPTPEDIARMLNKAENEA